MTNISGNNKPINIRNVDDLGAHIDLLKYKVELRKAVAGQSDEQIARDARANGRIDFALRNGADVFVLTIVERKPDLQLEYLQKYKALNAGEGAGKGPQDLAKALRREGATVDGQSLNESFFEGNWTPADIGRATGVGVGLGVAAAVGAKFGFDLEPQMLAVEVGAPPMLLGEAGRAVGAQVAKMNDALKGHPFRGAGYELVELEGNAYFSNRDVPTPKP